MSHPPSQTPKTACVLSAAAGLIILFGSVMLASYRVTAGLAWLAATSGGVTLVAGLLLWVTPRRHEALGVVLILASAVAVFAYGWAFPSALGVGLGLAAGIVAVQWESSTRVESGLVH